MLKFVFIKGVVSFALVTGVYKPPKPLNLSPKLWVRRLLVPIQVRILPALKCGHLAPSFFEKVQIGRSEGPEF